MSAKINPAAESADFKNVIDCLAVGAEADARITELQSMLHQNYLDLVDSNREDYVKFSTAQTQSEAAVFETMDMHPEWFEGKKKSVKTLYGTFGFRESTKLEVKNPEATIILLKQLGPESAAFIRTKEELDLEALEKMEDSELERIRVKRVKTRTAFITYAKPDMGKAVADSDEKGGES